MALDINYLMGKTKKTDEEKKKNEEEAQAIIDKVNSGVYNFGVDEDYINSFLDEVNGYVSDVQGSYQNIGYGTASSIYENTSQKASALREKETSIRAYLNTHSNISEDSKNSLLTYLDSYKRFSGNVVTNLYRTKSYYNKWDTEDDYNSYLSQMEEREKLLNYDVSSAQAKKAQLEEKYNSLAGGTVSIVSSAMRSRGGLGNTSYNSASEDEKKSLKKQIDSLTQEITLASRLQNAEKLKAEALSASDFREYSKIGANIENPTMQEAEYGIAFGLGTKKVANKVTYSREHYAELALGEGNGSQNQGSSLYHYMTEQEVSIYNYYLAKEGEEKADEYLDSIEETLNYRQATNMVEAGKDIPAFEVIMSFSAGLDQASSGFQGAVKMVTGDDSYTPVSSTQYASSIVRENLADTGAKLPDWAGGASLGQVAYDLGVNTVAQVPAMIVGTFAGPTAGALTTGVSAGGNAYTEKINLGYSKEQASFYAALTGASEAELSYLLSGIDAVGGKLTGNAINNLSQKLDSAIARVAIQLGGRMASEFTEEYLQEILDPFFENLALGAENEISLISSDAIYSGILGALTAGFLEGPSTISENVDIYKTGKEIKNSGVAVDGLKSLGETFPADSVAYRLAGKVDENTGAYTIGRLFNEVGAEITAANKADIQKSLERKGIDPKSAEKITETLAAVVAGTELSSAQAEILNSNKDIAKTVMDVIINPNSTVNQRTGKYADLYNLARETAGAKVTENTNQGAQTDAGEVVEENATTTLGNEKTAFEGEYKVSDGGETFSNVTGEKSEVAKIASIKDGKMTLKLENGEEVDAENVSFGSQDEAIVYETVAKLPNINAEAANLLIKNMDLANVSAEVYAKGIEEAYRFGTYSYPASEMTKAGALTSYLSEQQRMQAYRLGQSSHKAATEAKEATIRKKRTVQSTTDQAKKADSKGGKVHFGGNKEVLNQRQKTSVEALEDIAKALGIEIYLFESPVVNGKRQGANGWFDPKDGSIHIDIFAGQNGEATMLFTAAHELTHFIKEWSPAKFDVLANFLMEEYGKNGVSVEELVRAQQEKAKRQGREISYDVAFEEVVADSMETMLSDGKVMEKLAKLKAKDKTLWQKIKSYIDELVSKIKAAYEGLNPDSLEGQYVADMVDAVEKLQQLFTEGVIEASDNFKAAQETETETENEPEDLFSLREISEISEDEYKEAESFFGATKNYDVAGYLLLNGKMLDFSGKHWGDDYSTSRQVDHRDIWDVWENSDKDGVDEMINMIGNGNIRLMPENGGINLAVMPNEEQMKTLRGYINHFKGEVVLDIDQVGGDTIHSAIYDRGTSSSRIISDIRNYFEDGIVPEGNSNIKWSLRDSDGNEISEQQAEYFKDSKVRDEKGSLAVVYHGTRKADFTKFNRNFNFFTDSREMAESYSPNGEMFSGYLDIKNPFTIDAKGEKWSKIPIDGETKKFLDKYGASTFKEQGQWRTTPADIASAIQDGIDEGEFDYDGIIIKNVDDTGSYYKTRDNIVADDFIAFNSNQFKNLDNKTPTEDADVRYSLRNDEGDPRKVTEEGVRDLLQRAYNGEFDRDTYVPVSIKTPSIIIEHLNGYIQMKDLPIIMNVGKVQQMMEEDDGRYDGGSRLHGLDEDQVISIFKGMFDPEYIVYQQDNGRGVAIVKYAGGKANRALAVIDFGSNGKVGNEKNPVYLNGYQGGFYNILVTAFSPDSLESYLGREENIIVYEKKKGNSRGSSGSLVPSLSNESPFFEKRITQKGDDVKYSLRSDKITQEAEKDLLGSVAKYFGISGAEAKQSLGPIIGEMSTSLLEGKGDINSLQQKLFETAFEKGKQTEDLRKEYEEIRKYIKETAIYVDEGARSDFGGDYETFRKSNMGKLRLTSDPKAMSIDDFYSELAGMSLGFDSSITDPKAQLEEIADFMDRTGRNTYNLDRYANKEEYIFAAMKDSGISDAVVGYYMAMNEAASYEAAENEDGFAADREGLSNRSLLANAFEGIAQNSIEKQKILEYKSKIELINSEEAHLHEVNEKIKELSFAKGPKDTKQLKELHADATRTANRISTFDKQLLRLEASKPLQDVIDRERRMAYKRAQQKGKQAVTAARQKAAETQREIIQRYQESRKKAVEGREKTALRHKIKGVVNELNQILLHGTKDKHVMIGLQKAVAEALDAVNMDTIGAEERIAKYDALIAKANDPDVIASLTATKNRIQQQGDNLAEKIAQLKATYGDIKNSDDPLVANGYDEVIASKIDSVVSTVGNTPLRAMSTQQLEDVYDMYKMVLTRIRGANESFMTAKKETISSLANRVMAEVEHVGGKKLYRLKGADKIGRFAWNNLKPVYAFERIGSRTFGEVFKNVRAGEDTWAKDVTEAKDFFQEESRKYRYDKWDMKRSYSFTSKTGQNFKLTLPQIMSLYAYSKRKQADKHLELGGFVFDSNIEITEKKNGIPVKYTVNTATAHNISREILSDIIGKLTAEQKAFVDEMQKYLSSTMGEKGNEVSLSMYGVKLFKEENYFPLKSAKQFMFEQNETAGEVKIKNSGFSKETTVNASNPIVLSDFMDVWANHVNDMSMYHAFVLPLEDFNRVFNYKTPTSESMDTESVKQFIQNAYGKEANDYISQLIKDLNGGAVSDPRETTAKRLIANFKKAAVFSSASVVIQQPSAIGRAFAIIDSKYFIGGKVGAKGHKTLWEEVKKYAPVAAIKEMGYFDTNMGRSTIDFITGKEYRSFVEKAKGIFIDSEYRDEVLSKAPALADEITWCSIWNAVKRETKAKNPGLNIRSEEFLNKAGERFTEVITKTQVYDSVLSRSANMRSKSTFMNMWTAFMAEPTTSINMLEDALRQGKRGNKAYARKAIGAVYGSMVLNSVLVSLVYAARDDDEDETFLEKYLSSLATEIVDGINPLTYLPFFKDVWSALQGFDIERADMSLITKLIDAGQSAIKVFGEDTEDMTEEELEAHDKKVVEAIWDVIDNISSLVGIPVKNMRRDINGAINLVETVEKDLGGRESTFGSIADKVGDAVKNALPIIGWMEDESKGDKLYEAIINGDETYAERLEDGFSSENSRNSAIRTALRDNDPRIREAALARIDGDPATYLRIAKAIIADGFGQDDVVKAINAEINAINKGESEGSSGSSKATGFFSVDDYIAALEGRDQAAAVAVRSDIINTYIANGKDSEEAEKSFTSSFKSAVWEGYENGELTKSQVSAMLTNYAGMDEAEVEIKFEVYEWKATVPGADDITASAIADYNEYCEPAGISKADYYTAWRIYCDTDADVDPTTGEGIAYSKVKKVMPQIDALPLTSAQKTALALCWWAKSTVQKYKTW